MKTYSDNCGVLPETAFHPMPTKGRVLLADRVAHDGRETLVLGRNGRLYAHSARRNVHQVGYTQGTVEALVALGVFTRKQLNEWKKAGDAREHRLNNRYSARVLTEKMKVLGIKPTKAQEQKLLSILGDMAGARS